MAGAVAVDVVAVVGAANIEHIADSAAALDGDTVVVAVADVVAAVVGVFVSLTSGLSVALAFAGAGIELGCPRITGELLAGAPAFTCSNSRSCCSAN